MKKLILAFLELGALSFGGPVGAMALMEKKICREKKWVTPAQFKSSYFICKLLPGPVATQLAIRLGRESHGIWGGVFAGLSFILPAFLIVMGLGQVLSHYAHNPVAQNILTGLRISAIAMVCASTWSFAKPWIKVPSTWGIVPLSAFLVSRDPSWEPLWILIFGFLMVGLTKLQKNTTPRESASLFAIFLTCFKASVFIFGTGLAVIPVLEHEFVSIHQWVSREEFLNGLLIGQITPGPLLITATYLGYQAAGLPGSLVSTAGSFGPSFINVLVIVPWIEKRFKQSVKNSGGVFMSGAMPAIIGGLLAATVQMSSGLQILNPRVMVTIFFTVVVQMKFPAWMAILSGGIVFQVIQTFFPS